MDATVARPAHRWTVDLVVGRRWWVLPLVVVVVSAVLSGIYSATIAVHSGYAARLRLVLKQTLLMGAVLQMISYSVAVLNAHGARWRHRLASILLGLSGAAASETNKRFVEELIQIGILSVTYLAWIRLIGWPRWWVQPSLSRQQGIRIPFLLGITAAAAAVISSLKQYGLTPPELGQIALVIVALNISTVVGASLGASRRWPVAATTGGGLYIALACLICIPHRQPAAFLPGELPDHFWLSVVCATWAICYFHRCDRGKRDVPIDDGSPAVVAGSGG